jgi:hypothetical protein
VDLQTFENELFIDLINERGDRVQGTDHRRQRRGVGAVMDIGIGFELSS